MQAETLSAIHAELQQALGAPAAARDVQARLLLATVDGLMFHAVSAPGTMTPADLEAALDACLDRLLPADDHP